MTQPGATNAEEVAAQMAILMDMLTPMREAIVGYRTQLIADGFNETAAEMMAMELHAAMIRNIGK